MEENNVKKTSVLAVVSLVLSLVGLLIFGGPLGIAAIITGIIGIVKFDKETQKGKGMAIAGIVVGAVDVILIGIFVSVMALKAVY